MTKSQSATTEKKFADKKLDELKFEELVRPGNEGGTKDFIKKPEFVPSFATKGPNSRFKSALVEKDPNEYTTEYIHNMLPQSFRDKGYTVDEGSIKFTSTDRVISVDGEKQVVTLTQVTFASKPPSLYADNKEVMELAAKAKTPKKVKVKEGEQERVMVVMISDLQAGQADGGGPESMVNRVQQVEGIVREEIRKNNVLKTPITKIFVATLGDLVEGVAHFYNTQTFAVKLDRREQVKVARRLIQKLLMGLSELGIPIDVATVPGNHGENRNVGGAFTTINDNDDVAIMEQIQEAFDMNPEKFGHVKFFFPEPERLSLTVEICGWAVGLVHGHQAGSPKNMGASIRNYLNSQSRALQAIGWVNYFLMGHFHHYYCERISEQTTAVMNGAMCDASDHFQQRGGLASPACFVIGILTRKGDEGFIPHYID